jgi:hypothetical protein
MEIVSADNWWVTLRTIVARAFFGLVALLKLVNFDVLCR